MITVDPQMTDAVTAYLASLTGTGLEITSAAEGSKTPGPTMVSEKITAYLPISLDKSGEDAAQEKIKELRGFLGHLGLIFPDCPPPHLLIETIIEEDWGKKWKSFFTSFSVTPRLIIKPSWEETAGLEGNGAAEKFIIEMDPGLAFGTGHHASTQLALLLLEDIFQDSSIKLSKVLDVGTGSGILAMACGLFGAREVLALDNDPDAVETAKLNISRNRLESRISVSGRDITSLDGGFDLVVANITHDILAELVISLAGLINAQGILVLAGILKGEQEEFITKVYAEQGMEFIKSLTRDEWAALLFRKT